MASIKKRALKRGGAVYDVCYRDPRGRPRERTFKSVDDDTWARVVDWRSTRPSPRPLTAPTEPLGPAVSGHRVR